jgi:prefoldin subunit 5
MKNLLKEINSKPMGDKAKLELLADLTTKDIVDVNRRLDELQKAVELMQYALVKIEKTVLHIEYYLENLENPDGQQDGKTQD